MRQLQRTRVITAVRGTCLGDTMNVPLQFMERANSGTQGPSIRLTSDVKLRAAFQARGHGSGVPFAANELHAASGELQTA